ncbi:L-amino acid N-acyltransferase YncA [Jatrophihabitans endophyticus]|uniref:L-amino acid N-acyltransferase YncA n=1 Tax=Jatrophihabitans endophyticus TaxID=1206085 RepID=A0A1M5MIF7_9ACTN|nr:GNAT family N-acetyltransferase [Jatrophihabitans endophyticus]SHG77214.1 L-amino acid N-acyltransferase YncA [Jatrophihabitans endophyticus]
MADVSVRAARPDDAAEIGRIQVDTWRTAYAAFVPAAVLDSIDAAGAAEAWSAAVTAPPSPRHHVLVALEQQWRVGFAALGPAEELQPDDPEPATTGTVAAMLVEPRWGRRGHGSRLLAAVVDHARADGLTRLVTWIPEGDEATRTFLESAGWAADGLVRALDTGAGELRELRLHTEIAEATEHIDGR